MKTLISRVMLAVMVGVSPVGAGVAAAETLLRLSESARVNVHPDELVASLKVAAASISAAEAQNRVNATVAMTMEQVRATPGVNAATGNYQVWNTKQPEQWNAEQSVDLRSRDGAGLLRLVGNLQQQGLILSRLGWRVAADTNRQARAEATRLALGGLRARADEAAAVIGLRFGSFRDIRLDGPGALPGPVPRMALAAAAAAPTAEADDVTVESTVEADVILLPFGSPPERSPERPSRR